eukprot:313914-Amphidinium_carterae.1
MQSCFLFLFHVAAGHSRVGAAQSLIGELRLSEKTSDVTALREAVKRHQLPGLGAEVASQLSVEAILYLAITMRGGIGKHRRISTVVKVGDHP